jgi:prepilin-type N-terminal cleavage/methylation domain-containing protein
MRDRCCQSGIWSRSLASGRRAGFTLIELLASIAVLGALGSIAAMTLASAINGYTSSTTRAQLHAELSIALDRIDRELRKIDSETAGASPDLNWITPDSIAWNGAEALALSGDQVLFFENGSLDILLDDVTAFSVQAFDHANGLLGASLDDDECDPVRRLQVTITLQRNGVSETLRTKLYIRCLMEGA